MIRQHFYPKAYFRHRSLSKGHSQKDCLSNQNYEPRCPRQIQCNQIKFKRKKSFVHDKNSRVFLNEETVTHSDYDKTQQKVKTSTSKIQAFIQQQAHTEIYSQMHTTVLKQIHNRAFKQVSTQQRLKPAQKQNDLKNLFVKSDRKEIIKAGRNSYRVLQHSHSDNESFLIEGEWINSQNKKRNSTRKLASADASHRCYRKSIERKKKKDETPAEIIINASLSTVDVPTHKLTVHSERMKEIPVFEKMTQNLINLNLSKAIKYRQSSMQDKIRRQRKNSQKISLENIENRNNELEQKVRGWEIMVEDDVQFS